MKVIDGILVFLSVFLLSLFLFLGGIIFILEKKCDKLENMSQRDTRYEIPGGCYIRVDDGTYVKDNQFVVHN